MTSNQQHIRRKLQQIIDRVQAGDYKKALKVTNSHIQKSKYLSEKAIFLCQKCNINFQSNKIDELKSSMTDLKQVLTSSQISQKDQNLSQNLFNSMQFLWTSTGKQKEFQQIVENFYKRIKNTPNHAQDMPMYMMNLYLENGEFLKLNGIIKQLSKISKDSTNKYDWWSAFSLFMLSKTTQPQAIGLAKLSSAGLVKKYEKSLQGDGDHPAAISIPIGDVQLYTKILSQSGDWKQSIKVIDTFNSVLAQRQECYGIKLKIPILLHHKQYKLALNECIEILDINFVKNRDNGSFELVFQYIELAFSLLFYLISSLQLNGKTSRQYTDSIVEQGASVEFCKVELDDTDGISDDQFRRVYSSLIYSFHTLKNYNPPEDVKNNITYILNIRKSAALGQLFGIHKLLNYAHQQGSQQSKVQEVSPIYNPLVEFALGYYDTPSLLNDLQPYLHYLTDQQQRQNLLQGFKNKLTELEKTLQTDIADKIKEQEQKKQKSSASSSFSVEIKHLQSLTNYLRLSKQLSTEGRLDIPTLNLILSTYRESLTYQKTLSKGQHRVGDDLILLALDYLLNENSPQYHEAILTEEQIAGIMIAHVARIKSPHNYFITLKVLRLLSHKGLNDIFKQMYSKLEVKAVLYESIGYIAQMPLALMFDTQHHSFLQKKLDKFHKKASADLKRIKETGLTEKNFSSLQHFFDFEQFNKHSYFKNVTSLCSELLKFQEKSLGEQNAMDMKLQNRQQILSMLENISGMYEQKLKPDGGVYCDKRSSDITLVLSNNQRIPNIEQIYQQYSKQQFAFFEDCDDKLKLIVTNDPLIMKYKQHSKTNFKKGLINTMSIFEQEESLEIIMRLIVEFNSIKSEMVGAEEDKKVQDGEQSKEKVQIEKVLEQNKNLKIIEDKLQILISRSQLKYNSGQITEYKWFIRLMQSSVAGVKYLIFLSQITKYKLGLRTPQEIEAIKDQINQKFKAFSQSFYQSIKILFKQSIIPPLNSEYSRQKFISSLQNLTLQNPSINTQISNYFKEFSPPILRRTNLIILLGFFFFSITHATLHKMTSNLIGRKKKTKKKTDKIIEKQASLKQISNMTEKFRKQCLEVIKQHIQNIIQNSLKNKDLNLLSDCYVEYGRAITQYNKQESYIGEAFKFVKLTLHQKEVNDWKSQLDEILRNFVQNWERTRRILIGSLMSFVVKFSDV